MQPTPVRAKLAVLCGPVGPGPCNTSSLGPSTESPVQLALVSWHLKRKKYLLSEKVFLQQRAGTNLPGLSQCLECSLASLLNPAVLQISALLQVWNLSSVSQSLYGTALWQWLVSIYLEKFWLRWGWVGGVLEIRGTADSMNYLLYVLHHWGVLREWVRGLKKGEVIYLL